ncbi:MAG: hypothetical protein IPK75_17880 [Acidobacteria bacterium]|nr:hypothetical protein [Acidobacteriota bacterium]
MPRPKKLVAAAPAPIPATTAPTIAFTCDWSKLRTPDLLLFQELARLEQMSETEKNTLTLKIAPLLDRVIIGGMPDLPMDRYGDLITAFFAQMQARANTKN